MPHHAIDITLTRPATRAEIKAALQHSHLPFAADIHRTQLLTLVPAKNPHRALHTLRKRLGRTLPIDVLCTHFADSYGDHVLNLELDSALHAALCRTATQYGTTPEEHLRDLVFHAVARDQQAERARLDAALDHYLAGATPAQLLAAVARKLT